MKNKPLIVLVALALLTLVVAAGCAPSYATNEQVMSLQSQVNSLSNALNSTQQQLVSTQQQLASTQQQLNSAQQSLSQMQTRLQQQTTYSTSSQPVYQPNTIYQTYPYVTPYYYRYPMFPYRRW
jgi:peptidoglycan hydrolase CwlO-like protein